MRVRKDHRQSIDADAFAGSGRHAMSQRADIVLVPFLGNFFASLRNLRQKSAFLLRGVVQFGEAVGNFHAGNVNLKTLSDRRIARLLRFTLPAWKLPTA